MKEQQKSSIKDSMIKEILNYPFGTLLTMEVVIIDGYDTFLKENQDKFLLKIVSVNNKKVDDTIILTFKDDSGNFPETRFKFYDIYDNNESIISQKEKEYINKTFKIIAYETGKFIGIPEDYFQYHPLACDMGFHFENYLVIVVDLTETK